MVKGGEMLSYFNENNEALFLGSEAEKLKEFHQQMNEVMITKQEGN
ncbi:hypothetical protein [Lactococcus garvieae]|nr:hypothetical protein [Lactococcus garvieae]